MLKKGELLQPILSTSQLCGNLSAQTRLCVLITQCIVSALPVLESLSSPLPSLVTACSNPTAVQWFQELIVQSGDTSLPALSIDGQLERQTMF